MTTWLALLVGIAIGAFAHAWHVAGPANDPEDTLDEDDARYPATGAERLR